MAKYIDENFWKKSLEKPDWYLLLKDDFDRLEKLAQNEQDYSKQKQIKNEAYKLLQEAILNKTLVIADSGDDFDVERKPIDTIVIHHTKNRPGMTLERLNAIHLIRIYGRYFSNPTSLEEEHLKGQPVWSGHFYNSEQVFWGYHWLIREDGTAQQILDDRYIGWHAGNWDINTRSIAFCIDDDLTNKEPSELVMAKIVDVIKLNYPSVNPSHIIGHCEANRSTKCPGDLFYSIWKEKLLTYF
jgi:hypothetical protein